MRLIRHKKSPNNLKVECMLDPHNILFRLQVRIVNISSDGVPINTLLLHRRKAVLTTAQNSEYKIMAI